ncbi:putative receptor protein kinase ZmPK1-like [Hibiscus syriacus]|uniref:Receptor protein kinase ZmPK1-like n=1 Tax=Hibiscus syriacus TaxID=106335 RepID=A0A6A3BWR7_HIBSY|nr:protein RETICULATA, chloroplastic-like [Hibiscus syriacus]XP_039065621.1 protein RETICULATA, chloroplastic-like [Hibiscus syriacus]KAE8719432.1 putative receptor protein kinase ZmPK1-like [Hibiscus syriacus]
MSGSGLSHLVNVKNDVVLQKLWAQDLSFVRNSSRRFVISVKKKRKPVTLSLSQRPEVEPQSGVATSIVTKESSESSVRTEEVTILGSDEEAKIDEGNSGGFFDGNDGNGKFNNGGGGGGAGGGAGGNGEKGDPEEDEFGPIMKFEEVMKESNARGATLPSDMIEAAKSDGIRKLLLLRYLDLQGSSWPLGFAMRSWGMLRNRMLADPSFLFKIGTEIVIDSCCATLAEVQKRGKDFWAEFELYLADLLVGVVVNVALVGMLAPYVRIGQPSISKGFLGRVQRAYGALPSSVFEAERPGCRFTVNQRIGTYFYKGVLYGSVGFACGIIGQGIANLIMTAKRSMKKSEEDIPVPPLLKSAALWGVFLAVSSNTRYQIVNGLERLVEASPLAKQFPPAAMAFTVGVRFANNIYGGMQFVDWAKWSGVQ